MRHADQIFHRHHAVAVDDHRGIGHFDIVHDPVVADRGHVAVAVDRADAADEFAVLDREETALGAVPGLQRRAAAVEEPAVVHEEQTLVQIVVDHGNMAFAAIEGESGHADLPEFRVVEGDRRIIRLNQFRIFAAQGDVCQRDGPVELIPSRREINGPMVELRLVCFDRGIGGSLDRSRVIGFAVAFGSEIADVEFAGGKRNADREKQYGDEISFHD